MKRKLSVALLVVAAFVGGVFFVSSAGSLFEDLRLTGPDARADEALANTTELGEAFEAVAERVNPAVVQIRSTRLLSQNEQQDPFGGRNPFEGTPWEDFFGRPPGGSGPGMPFEQNGLGSGAFVREDGYIVTNNHVVEGADELTVRLFDGSTRTAEVVGNDPFSDIAVLKVQGDGYPALAFGDVGELRVGQWVLAFGSPLSEDLSNSVTSGIVSALGRFGQGGGNSISNYIQTDAAINPGNSGGPLVNLRGEIVGINSAIATRTGGFQGIGFAVPVDIVRNSVEQLIESGRVERGYLGIRFTEVSPSLARALNVPLGSAQIASIEPDAEGRRPAADAGLREGDVIVGVGGRRLSDDRELVSLISNRRPGDRVEVEFSRDGTRRTATITLGRRPNDATAQNETPDRPGRPAPEDEAEPTSVESLGLTLQDLSTTVADRFGIDKEARGVVVTDVVRTSEAFREANLRPGDIILEVNRQAVGTVRDFERAYGAVRAGETFLLRVQRGAADNSAAFLTALTKPS